MNFHSDEKKGVMPNRSVSSNLRKMNPSISRQATQKFHATHESDEYPQGKARRIQLA
jgi:hypothetical protein